MRRHLFVTICLLYVLQLACSPQQGSQSSVPVADAGFAGDTSTAVPESDAADSGVDLEEAPDTEVQEADAISADAGPLDVPPFDYCDGSPPDADCFAQSRAPSSHQVALARAIGDKVLAEYDPASLSWDWGEAVMMIGIRQLAKVTGDVRYYRFVRDWLSHHVENGYEIKTSDTSAPAALAIGLMLDGQEVGSDLVVAEDALRYLREEALRTPEGGLSHFGTVDLLGITLWADSLFMFGNILTWWGEETNTREPLDEYAEQYLIFASLMQQESGFFRHAADMYNIPPFEQTDGIYWARANGWITAAGFDHLRVRRARGESVPAMERSLARLVEAIVAAQNPESGLWWNIVNRPGEIYQETSASALFAYGLARAWRYGDVGDEVLPTIEAGMRGVRSMIERDSEGRPRITGISGPTSVGTFDYYASVGLDDDISYGIGAVLLALTETSGLPIELEDPPSQPPIAAGEPVPWTPTEGFLSRKAEYLNACSSGNLTGGSVYGQSCRVFAGLTEFNDDTIGSSLEKINNREDTADFRATGLVRLLYLDNDAGVLGARRAVIEDAMLNFKYWIDEPGEDGMAYWTENHQILFHNTELLMGQLNPDTVFPNSGMTGSEHVAHALPRIKRWLDLRGRYGFSEWHSNVYFNEDIPALLNLVDFAEDAEVREKAAMVLDLMALDLLNNMYKGAFVTTMGRTYSRKWRNGRNDSTSEFAWITLGLGSYRSVSNFGAAFLATSSYAPPPILERLAETTLDIHEHRQRDGFNVVQGFDAGISYEGLDDVVVWAGMSALVAPATIDGAMMVMDTYNLWDGFLFGDLPSELLSLIRVLIGTPELRLLAEELAPVSEGISLEAVSTYVYRTPHFQIAGAQDYKPGMWGAQTLMWQAALTPEAFVLTTAPGLVGVDDLEANINDTWNGGWYPRATLFRDVGVIQYGHQGEVPPLIAQYISDDYSHAYFPRDAFDAVVERDGWIFGQAGTGYLALWSQHPWTVPESDPTELRVEGFDNVYVIQLGSVDDFDSFEAFIDAVSASSIEVTEDRITRFSSPTLGVVEVGWTGPMTVDDAQVDIGPYPRWDNAFMRQDAGADWLDVQLGDEHLRLDFISGTRQVFSRTP